MDVELMAILTDKCYNPARKRPENYGITVREFMEEKNCSETEARKLLEDAVKDGVIERHMMRTEEKKNPSAVYHRPGDWPPKE